MADKKEKIEEKRKRSGGEKVVLTLRQMLNCEKSLRNLSESGLRKLGPFRVAKAYKKIFSNTETYREERNKFFRDNGAVQSIIGDQIVWKWDDQDDPRIATTTELILEYDVANLDKEIEMTGILCLAYEEFLDSMPPVDGDDSRDVKVVTPKLLVDLDWLIMEPVEDTEEE